MGGLDPEATIRRSPCGERGLKFTVASLVMNTAFLSLPVRGAWIEILRTAAALSNTLASLPVRGAWIEIFFAFSSSVSLSVAPRAGSVD